MVSAAQVIAFRLARHHLDERVAAAREAAAPGLQDTPPGSAGTALAARADAGPEGLDELLIVPSLRRAPMAIDPDDLALFTAGLDPPDERSAKAILANATKTLETLSAMEALEVASEAVRDAPASVQPGLTEREEAPAAEAQRLAPFRDAGEAAVAWTG